MQKQYRKGINRVIGVFCALVLLFSALYVPMVVGAAAPVNSVDIKDDEAFLFDIENVVSDETANKNEAEGAAAIGYSGWGWKTKTYTVGDKTNTVIDASKNNTDQSWSTAGGYRLHTKKADGTYGFYPLAPSTKYMVTFKIRVLSSPVTISGSSAEATATLALAYNMTYLNNVAWASASNYVNYIDANSKIPVMSSLIDSNKFALYNSDGTVTEYPCSEEWHKVTYFITTPESFKYDSCIGFYTSNYHGGACEIDDVYVTKIGENSGMITLNDEYSGTKEYFIGKDGEELDLSDKDISDRANEEEHVFEGWYKDVARTEKVTKVSFVKGADTYVYSRWKAPVTITFKNTLDGSTSSVTGNPGDSFKYPADPVDPENKTVFVGWYADEQFTTLHTSGKFGYANETIYAYFKGEAPSLTQDFENYIRDSYTVKTDANGQKYKSNRLHFAPTMAKQSAVTYNGSKYAIKYHWNPVQIEDLNNENRYDVSRWNVKENTFNLGDGLDNNTVYDVTFKYYVEKASAPVKFFTVSAAWDNIWSQTKTYSDSEKVELEADGEWHEYSFRFKTDYKVLDHDEIFLGVANTANVETILYIDDVKVTPFAKPIETVITVNTGINDELVYIKGERGTEIKFPTLTHPDGAPLKGFCIDKALTTDFTETTYGKLPLTVYAKWGATPMTFENYIYEGQKVNDPGMKRVNEKGVGNGDDYAIQYVVNRTEDSNLGTTNALLVAEGIKHGSVYKVRFDYKIGENNNVPLSIKVTSADRENIWWKVTHSYSYTTFKLSANGAEGWHTVELAIMADVKSDASYGAHADDLVLQFSGQKYKAGEKVDVYLDNVLVEELNNPVIFFDGQNDKAGSFVQGEKGESFTAPKVSHPDDAKFIAWFNDEEYTNRFNETTFNDAFKVVYAKWSAFAMSFSEYPYEADKWKDPYINRVNKSGIGNGDDYAMQWFIDRKVDDTSNVGTSSSFRIATDIKHDAVYRVKFDYKTSSKTNQNLRVTVESADSENVWWNITHSYSYTTLDIAAGGTNGWKTYECYVRADVWANESYGGVTEDLYLAFGGKTNKAGEHIDLVIDNVLVEKVEGVPFVFFDGETAAFFSSGNVGDKIDIPTKLPARVGYDFAGWYLEPECKNKFTLTTFEADTELVVYAKWKEASTWVYSFEDYTCKEGVNYTHDRGVLATNIKKSGKQSMSFGKDDKEDDGGVFALEDGGTFFPLKSGTSYILKLNYYIKEHSDNNMGIRFVAAGYSNYYVAITNGSTGLTPEIVITAEQAKTQKGKWQTLTFALDTTKLAKNADGTDQFKELYCFLSSGQGWEYYIDDISITEVPKGKVAVAFQTEGVKGCPDYIIGKTGTSYADKVPEILEKEGKFFKGYFTKDVGGSFLEKERSAMVFGETSETLFARFLDHEINENFDNGYFDKAYKKGLGYTIHDFDYEVYDAEKDGNSKDNVTSGKYSLHRKGESMYNENAVILTLGNQIAEGERYTVTFKVKMGKHFHTDGAVKIVSSRSFQYAWTTTGDYYPVISIADLADGQWHEVSYTFNSVEAFVTLQTPGYVELFFDDFKFTLVDEKTPLSEPVQFTEYVAAKRDANGNLVKRDRNAIDVSTIIDDSLRAGSNVWLYVGIGGGAIVLVAVVLVLILFVFKKKKA